VPAERIRDEGLVARAAVHAALGEPGRLAVVELLLLGEASPSELQQRLGMPSNLLAHHLRVLEGAGLVARHRSEGDRRRSYVALVPGAVAAAELTGPSVAGAARVVFVCTHNSARSQLAAALWRDASPVPVASAGTRPAARVHPGALAAAGRRHLALVPVPPRHVDEVLDDGDLVVTVCDSAHEELTGSALAPDRPALHWSIPDPVRTGEPAAFDRVVDELTDRIARLTPAVHTSTPHPAPPENRRTS
jgi:ArsR family transcriptional regulator, arsenate/arsenite/antimonite-responsive transcriptional repressor / arsenate reductase (thioredoxin)